MSAPAGNQFWKERSSHGRKPIFESSEQLWEACEEYFHWVESNPLLAEKAFSFQGEIIKTDIAKMRAMTIGGLCIFLDISEDTWSNYRERIEDNNDFIGVTSTAERIIKHQKFSGAAADLLNANIIARDLGLTDKVDTTIANPDGTNIVSTDIEIARKLAFVLDKALKDKASE